MTSSSDTLSWKRRRLGSSLGIALSLIAHLLLLAALVFGVRQGFEDEPARTADLELIPTWPSSIQRRTPTRRAAVPNATRDIEPRPSRPPMNTAATIGEAPASAPPTATPTLDRPLAPALRLGLGCAHPDFMGLTDEERAACRDRFASKGAADRDYADAGIDPNRRAAFDLKSKTETLLRGPFLSAMPKKGCRPRVTEHDAAAFGKSQPDLTGEATCVVHF